MTVTLITGAGTLATHLTKILPGKLRTLSRSEAGRDKLRSASTDLVSVLAGDVCDPDRLSMALRGVETVIHTAALKRVDLCEYDPQEAVRVNVEGTRTLIRACVEASVKRALFISSDKACAPSTLYGATKLCGERMWLAANSYRGTEFLAVRYGNVWGSAGSVLPAFMAQAKTGQLSVTDPQATRFHLTLEEAGQFVTWALASGHAGRLYIPKLPSYRLGDLAKAFMLETGLTREPKVTCLRAAEKQHEELVGYSESVQAMHVDGRIVLDPSMVVSQERWTYSSGKNPFMLGVGKLREAIRAFA